MTLTETLQLMMQQNQQAGQPAELKIGTVTGTNPLEITINTAMAPLQASVLYLTEPVVEKKIIRSTALSGVSCLENGQPVAQQDGYLVLNRALETGDKVLLLRVLHGQKFIVLSRIMEGG